MLTHSRHLHPRFSVLGFSSRLFSHSSPFQTHTDLSSLLSKHGVLFSDKLSEDTTITTISFKKGLQDLLSRQQHDTVLHIHSALPALHRLVIPTHDLTFAAMAAFSAVKKPLKVCGVLVTHSHTFLSVHSCVHILRLGSWREPCSNLRSAPQTSTLPLRCCCPPTAAPTSE